MNYTRINKTHIKYFKQILNDNNVYFGEECKHYASDHTENLVFVPELVLSPSSTTEVAKILKNL